MEANILLFKCSRSNQLYGVRVQKMKDGDWWRTWAFKIKSQYAKREGYDRTQVLGNLNSTEDYPGCPYCGTYGFVQCVQCKKLSCWNGETSLICPWCGEEMENIIAATEKFSVTGDKF